MGSRAQSQLGNDRGAAAVEFALIAVFALLPLLLGIIEFGFAYQAQVTVTQAARAGARLAAICGSTCPGGVSQSTIDAAPGLAPSDLTVTIEYCTTGTSPTCQSGYCPPGATQADGNAVVTVSYKDTLTFAVLPNSIAPQIKPTGKASLPCGG